MILKYKIENHKNFGNPEKIMEYLSAEDQEKFLFNLDIFAC
jgi:hypothetical protein